MMQRVVAETSPSCRSRKLVALWCTASSLFSGGFPACAIASRLPECPISWPLCHLRINQEGHRASEVVIFRLQKCSFRDGRATFCGGQNESCTHRLLPTSLLMGRKAHLQEELHAEGTTNVIEPSFSLKRESPSSNVQNITLKNYIKAECKLQ